MTDTLLMDACPLAPDNCSWSVFDVSGDNIEVVELGRQAKTDVN